MRIPFIISMYTPRPLTALQMRRRTRLIEKSKCYRDYRKRAIGAARLRGKNVSYFKSRGQLRIEPTPLLDPQYWRIPDEIDAMESMPAMPVEQWVLEMDTRLRNAKAKRFTPASPRR